MKKLIVIADLGRIRTVKIREAGEDPTERQHLVEDSAEALESGPPSRGKVVTDQSGRFGRSAPAGEGGGMSYGEEHNLESGLEKKALQHLASKIGEIVAGEKHRPWILAAPQPILRRLKEALSPACREALSESLGADLTKEPIAKLEKRFLTGG